MRLAGDDRHLLAYGGSAGHLPEFPPLATQEDQGRKGDDDGQGTVVRVRHDACADGGCRSVKLEHKKANAVRRVKSKS